MSLRKESNEIKEIDRYLSDPNIAVLLYATAFKEINQSVLKGNNVHVFQYSSPTNLLLWLKNPTEWAKTHAKDNNCILLSMPYEAGLTITKNNKHYRTVNQTKFYPEGLCIIITVQSKIHKEKEYQCSATSLQSYIDDIKILDEVINKYPNHYKSMCIIDGSKTITKSEDIQTCIDNARK